MKLMFDFEELAELLEGKNVIFGRTPNEGVAEGIEVFRSLMEDGALVYAHQEGWGVIRWDSCGHVYPWIGV